MALTLADCDLFIERTLGGQSRYGSKFITNQAGRFLVAMHSWRYLNQNPTTLTATASQEYLELPAGTMGIASYAHTDWASDSVRMTTMTEILNLREGTSNVDDVGVWGAFAWADDSNGIPRPRLEIYPTPGGGETYSVALRKGWIEVSADSEHLHIPEFMETLFIQVLMAFARGYEEEDIASLNQRLEEFRAGIVFMTARLEDGRVQPDYGPTTGGAVEEGRRFAIYYTGANPPS